MERRLHARALEIFKRECELGASGQSELDQVKHVLRAYEKKPHLHADDMNSRVSRIAQAKLDELEANRCLASRLCVDSPVELVLAVSLRICERQSRPKTKLCSGSQSVVLMSTTKQVS